MNKNVFITTGISLGLVAMIGFAPLADAAESYTVKKGDTLYSIAQRYDTTVSALQKMNNLKVSTIYPSNVLKIGRIITVKKGDTLYKIATKYGMTVKELKKLNKINSDKLRIDQKLLVAPSEKSSEDIAKVTVSLKVKSGYTFDKEEPGKYILQYKKDGTYFVRIEVINSKTKLSDVKNNAKQYLRSTGKVAEIKPDRNLPFYKNASFFLYAYNSKIAQNVVVKKVDGQYVKFTIHYANKEESEGITPYMIEMLQTVKLK